MNGDVYISDTHEAKRSENFLIFLWGALALNRFVFREARKAARARGKHLLNVGCKGRFTTQSDVNLDIVPRNVPRFVQGDIQDLHIFRDKQFGAVYAAHVLEHVDDPDRALKELRRVSHNVFVITPLPIFPWVWLHPEHKWIMWGTRKLCRVPRPLRNFSIATCRGLHLIK